MCFLIPEGPITQALRTLVPNTIKGMVFGTGDLKHWVLGPSGNLCMNRTSKEPTFHNLRPSRRQERQVRFISAV